MATRKELSNQGSYVTQADIDSLGKDVNKNELKMLNFKFAAENDLAFYNLQDGMVDAYEDETGIDNGTSANETFVASTKAYIPLFGNYFGDGSLGHCQFGTGGVTQTSDTAAIDTVLTTGSEASGGGASSYGSGVPNSSECYEFTVANTSGSYDGDMVVLQFKDLTVDSGVTLTTKQPCRGMFIYVSGNCNIAGAISMTSRGGFADPTTSGGSDSNAVPANGLQIGMVTPSGTQTFTNDGTGFNGSGTAVRSVIAANVGDIAGNGDILTISRAGGSRQGPTQSIQAAVGNAGATGATTIGTGGGGRSACWGVSIYGGAGGAFSAGPGSGGGWGGTNNSGGKDHGRSGAAWHSAVDYGGRGGIGIDKHHGGYHGYCGGGAGNPGGDNDKNQTQSTTGFPAGEPGGNEGVGGIVWLIVQGNVTIAGGIQANGKNGHSADSQAGGSGSGGGAIHVAHAGTYSLTGSLAVSGGGGGSSSWNVCPSGCGGTGGAGGTNVLAVSAQNTGSVLSLFSNAVAAVANPVDIRMMIFEEDVDATTINTDVQGFVSRDGGTTYTQVTLVDEGLWGTANQQIYAGTVDVSGQPAGSSIKYKILQHNSKSVKIHGCSLMWNT